MNDITLVAAKGNVFRILNFSAKEKCIFTCFVSIKERTFHVVHCFLLFFQVLNVDLYIYLCLSIINTISYKIV